MLNTFQKKTLSKVKIAGRKQDLVEIERLKRILKTFVNTFFLIPMVEIKFLEN